jgi:ABC-type multidrug transport system fused ATPase/permease subunit
VSVRAPAGGSSYSMTDAARFLYRQLDGYRTVLLASIILALVQVGTELLLPVPLKFIIDKAANKTDPGAFWDPFIAPFDHTFGTDGGRHGIAAVILFSVVLMIAVGLAAALVSYAQLKSARVVGFNVCARLRVRVFDHLLKLPLSWHGLQKTGDLVQRVTGNVADIEKLIIDGLVDLLVGSLTLVMMLAVMLVFSWQFTLLAVVVVPVLFVVVISYTKRIKVATKRAAKAAGQIGDVVAEDVRAIDEVKAMNLERRESTRFREYVETYRAGALRAGSLESQFNPLVVLLTAVSAVTTLGVGSWVATGHDVRVLLLAIPAGTLQLGTITLFLAYLQQMYQPMRDLSKLMYIANNATAGAERLEEVLNTGTEPTPDAAQAAAPPAVPRARARLRGAIDFQGVRFGYQPSRPVLNGVDMSVPAGQKVALVGLSGSGKTTLVKLIPRFYVPNSGSVLIDGVDTREYELLRLRRNIGVVLQESILFEGTIRDNIAIGRPDATARQVETAARMAQIHDTIEGLPDRYETKVREQGRNFSGGQRQRLSIARAILRDSPILILDEPTASLDVEAEAEVMLAIEKLVQGRTVFMISHRLSTLGRIDRIIVLKDGRMVEDGNFQSLQAQGGVFAGLLDQQNRYGPQEENRAEGTARPQARPEAIRANRRALETIEMGTFGWAEAMRHEPELDQEPAPAPEPAPSSVPPEADARRLRWMQPVRRDDDR